MRHLWLTILLMLGAPSCARVVAAQTPVTLTSQDTAAVIRAAWQMLFAPTVLRSGSLSPPLCVGRVVAHSEGRSGPTAQVLDPASTELPTQAYEKHLALPISRCPAALMPGTYRQALVVLRVPLWVSDDSVEVEASLVTPDHEGTFDGTVRVLRRTTGWMVSPTFVWEGL